MASDPPQNEHSEAAGADDAVPERAVPEHTEATGAATERPAIEPMETNDVLIVSIGTALFAVAFVILLALRTSLERSGHGRWPWVAFSGMVLGLIGLVYCRRRQQKMSKVNAE